MLKFSPLPQMVVDGVISFGQPPPEVMNSNEAFPTGTGAYLVAPFSTSLDLSSGGSVVCQLLRCNTTTSQERLERVSDFISQVKNISFEGTWMFVATWNNVPQLHFNDNLVSF